MKIKQKIFNDPVYGFITIPAGIILDIIDHPYLQRLRRIKQTGLTHLVYPGALHTRFHHTLGAVHLMIQSIQVLRSKGVEVSEEEQTAVCLAILLHDVGHGPFSHALEKRIVSCSHENISLFYMQYFNQLFPGKLDLTIDIFTNKYHRKFLSQLVSGQLDMDRMDYLKRDSFYTGVTEGMIGHDRIIKMLDVRDNILVIEEKGIYSIEKFLISRRLMYWQVYLHKTSVAAELMLKKFWERVKQLHQRNQLDIELYRFEYFLKNKISKDTFQNNLYTTLEYFSRIDDIDMIYLLKEAQRSKDKILNILSNGILDRKLYKLAFNNKSSKNELIISIRSYFNDKNIVLTEEEEGYLVIEGIEKTNIYESNKNEEIMILLKDDKVVPFSTLNQLQFQLKTEKKHYLCALFITQ